MVEPIDNQDMMDNDPPADGQEPGFLQDAEADVKTIVISASADPEDDMLRTLAFWFVVIAIIFAVGRYSDTLYNSARRFFAGTSAEDEEIRALKLSGGNEHSDVSESIGEKIRDFAKASSETIKKTLSRGRDTINAAAGSM